jgi:hypothetical protein
VAGDEEQGTTVAGDEEQGATVAGDEQRAEARWVEKWSGGARKKGE